MRSTPSLALLLLPLLLACGAAPSTPAPSAPLATTPATPPPAPATCCCFYGEDAANGGCANATPGECTAASAEGPPGQCIGEAELQKLKARYYSELLEPIRASERAAQDGKITAEQAGAEQDAILNGKVWLRSCMDNCGVELPEGDRR